MINVLWEIVIPILLACLVGLFIGWMLWRWRRARVTKKEWNLVQQRTVDAERRAAELTSSNSELDARAITLDVELESVRKHLGRVRSEHGDLTVQLDSTQSSLSASTARVDELEDALSKARSQLKAFASMPSRLIDVQARVRELEAELESANSRIAGLEAEVGATNGLVGGVEAELSHVANDDDEFEGGADLSVLQGGLAGVRDTVNGAAGTTAEQLPAVKFTTIKQPAAIERATAEQSSTSSPDWQHGVTELGTPGARHSDDLKVISGIGSKTEVALSQVGITSWEQIGALGAADIELVTEAIDAFADRIERDAWVEQAKNLIERFPQPDERPTKETFLKYANG